MLVLYILLALFILIVLSGLFFLNYTSVRHKVDDMWDETLVRKHGYGELWESIRSGRDWLQAQAIKPLTAVAYDGKLLSGFLVPCDNARATIILFHGWRSSWKLDFCSVFEYYNSLGLNIIAVDERAHGESEGQFITFGIRERHDVLTWVTYAAQLLGEDEPIFIDGVSMGATTVLMAADFDFPANLRGIIADCGFISPYTIMDSVIMRANPHLPRKPILWLLNIFTQLFAGFSLNEHSTLQALRVTKYPVLMVHGTADSFVPYEMSQLGYDACTGDKELILVEGAEHGMSFFTEQDRLKVVLETFISKHIG